MRVTRHGDVLVDMDHESGTTRRRALGLTAALLAGGTIAGRIPDEPPAPDAPPAREDALGPEDVLAPGTGQETDGACAEFVDWDYEAALAEILEPGPDQRQEDRDLAETDALSRPRWARPLRRSYKVTARYRLRGPWLAGHHTGIDLAAPQGTPAYAVGSGVVVLARRSGAYGKAVTMRLPDGSYALYAHLSRIQVREGQRVTPGQRIGLTGATGRATGPHLHFEVRARRHYGTDIDPVRYMAGRGIRIT
ncbi:M23 family metallopeptidase [Streptomyces sp. NBC_00663]|uniref:M23 family metallopeptidase n=1 Tax=Streptomyces sp. NBC_00663 TaxID=2975801 RepID=UPI002E31797E|nr:M23 family metallopeptidase [Streptomyces sp. NBC_00663]